MKEEEFDYIVIGAGVNGSWTAYHLSKRGFKVLLLDQVNIFLLFLDYRKIKILWTGLQNILAWSIFQFPLPHSRGSSHGQTRGIRKAYYEYFYAEMMSDAYEQWHELERESDTELLK